MDNSSFAVIPFFQDNLLVVIALVLCGVVAVLVLIGMAWGAKLKRARVRAEEEEEARIEALEADGKIAPTEAQETVGATPVGASAAPHPGAPPAPEVAPAPDAAADPAPLDDDPIAAAAPLDASPASEAETAPAASADAPGDQPVTTLKGLGPKVAARLAELGITHVGEIAALDDARAAALDAELGAFQGRMARDQWREQAQLLAAGDRAGYEARYGKLGA